MNCNVRFQGRVTVVTGGARGIGAAVAERVVGEGGAVVLVDLDGAVAQKAAAEMAGDIIAVEADVSTPEGTAHYVSATLDAYGRIDHLVNNAGVTGRVSPIIDLAIEDFDRVMSINVRGAFLGTKAALREMRRQGAGGSIVNVASLSGILGSRNLSPYVISKHALMGLTRCSALEASEFGVRANAVCPGPVDTEMRRESELNRAVGSGLDVGDLRRQFQERNPLGRYGTPEDVAALIVWLLGPESSYITGVGYVIDGGLTAAY